MEVMCVTCTHGPNHPGGRHNPAPVQKSKGGTMELLQEQQASASEDDPVEDQLFSFLSYLVS